MSRISKRCAFIWGMAILVVLLTGVAPAQNSDRSPFWAAFRQTVQTLTHPEPYLWVMPRPGSEDFRAIAGLLVNKGIRSAFVYASNGEALPDLREQWSVRTTAGRRKAEAAKAAGILGGEAFFLNLTDNGGLRTGLSQEDADSAVVNLARVIRMVRPSTIVLGTDRTTGIGSPKETGTLREIIARAIDLGANGKDSLWTPRAAANSWSVGAVWVESAADSTGLRLEPETATGQKRTRDMETEARAAYSSMESGIEVVHETRYTQVSGTRFTRKYFGDGLSGAPSDLASSERAIRDLQRLLIKTSSRPNALKEILRAQRTLAGQLAMGRTSLSQRSRHTLIFWKGLLDKLQWMILDPPIRWEVSDTVLMERQLFTLSVHVAPGLLKEGNTQILFELPAGDSWIVNEKIQRIFDLSKDTVFRIITPPKIAYTYPLQSNGLAALSTTSPFRFALIHDSRDPRRRFIKVEEVGLKYAPNHSSAILTPAISIGGKDGVVVDSYNASRDRWTAQYWFDDTVCTGASKPIVLSGKGESSRDTILPVWYTTKIDTSREVVVRIGRLLAGSMRTVNLKEEDKIAGRVGILSRTNVSALERSARRLYGDRVLRLPENAPLSSLDSVSTMVIDQWMGLDAAQVANLVRWVHQGGRAVIFPQTKALRIGSKDSIWFRRTAPVRSSDSLIVSRDGDDSANSSICYDYLRKWESNLAWEEPRWTAGVDAHPDVSSGGNTPIVVTVKEGRGTIVLVALNLYVALEEIYPGAHQILGSLVSGRKE